MEVHSLICGRCGCQFLSLSAAWRGAFSLGQGQASAGLIIMPKEASKCGFHHYTQGAIRGPT